MEKQYFTPKIYPDRLPLISAKIVLICIVFGQENINLQFVDKFLNMLKQFVFSFYILLNRSFDSCFVNTNNLSTIENGG